MSAAARQALNLEPGTHLPPKVYGQREYWCVMETFPSHCLLFPPGDIPFVCSTSSPGKLHKTKNLRWIDDCNLLRSVFLGSDQLDVYSYSVRESGKHIGSISHQGLTEVETVSSVTV